ncbi:Sphingosine N-acyltransferase lac1 [Grifola frondosa]|uniref:Sphingosine N-acyltransferase lac1 n=1 Tax=Grifola frondosa TaxID=5627 RepID=A0A1C7M143_GRIFR|nr:Sphingosine N-acyltransferase lac1 [Grifola frondosa]
MASSPNGTHKPRPGALQKIETDPAHHLAGPFIPQTPLDANAQDPWSIESRGFWSDIKSLRWVVVPSSSFKMLLIPIVLWVNWELMAPYVATGFRNPFSPLLFISHRVSTSSDNDSRYAKGYLDLVFIAYYIVFWSLIRQLITIKLCRPIARWFGIRKEGKLDRFGEQGYAVIYFLFMAIWGIRIMSQLPTWWYRTEYFWIDYPHWDMKPELKRYYLMQAAYWCQQLIVLLLGLEKPRKDYGELVAHHFVTLWLVGWSYLVNLTLIGNAVYVSMDLPDVFLALSKLLNYIQYDKTKIALVFVFLGIWTYFRHWLNFVIMYSVWTQFDFIPETAKRWYPAEGVWMVWWMKYQVFVPILLLQFLNLFWYMLILRIVYRALTEMKATDVRSDDEDEGEPDVVPDGKED